MSLSIYMIRDECKRVHTEINLKIKLSPTDLHMNDITNKGDANLLTQRNHCKPTQQKMDTESVAQRQTEHVCSQHY